MQKNRAYVIPALLMVFSILACNLQSAGTPGSNVGAAATAVAQTVTALAALPTIGSSATNTPGLGTLIPPTASPLPTTQAAATNTPNPTATQVCDSAQFISETIPDGTIEAPGVSFTKTWRLKNIGACTWTTSYNVVFLSGDTLGAPSAVPLGGNVAPGQQVDIAVNMQAPAPAGNYTGSWTLRNASGVLFGLGAANGPFWIKITVVLPTATAGGPILHLPIIPILLTSVNQVLNQISVPASGSGHAVVTCPSGSVVTGGGFASSTNLLVFSSLANGNGWEADAQNLSAYAQALNVYAECLSSASGTTQQVFAQATVNASAAGNVAVNCPSGSVVTGGGFASSTNLAVFTESANGNGWQVYAQNKTASSQLLNAYAICLSGTAGTSQSLLTQVTVAANGNGHLLAVCPSGAYLTGGGYAGSSNLAVFSQFASGTNWEVDAHNTSGGTELLNSYGMCLTLP